MPRYWERSQLDSEIRTMQDSALKAGSNGIAFGVQVGNLSTMKYDQSDGSIKVNESNLLAECSQVLDTAGASTYWLSYNPVDTRISMQKMLDASSWDDCKAWFQNVLRADSGSPTIVPDTNVLMNHHLSKIISPLTDHSLFQTAKVAIPRTVILEMERQGNLEGKNFKKRKALYGWSEMLWLLDNGSTILGDLDIKMIEGFSQIAGSRFGDALVRKEIRDHFGVNSTNNSAARAVFLTCDLMNAFAACAERIDTLYLARGSRYDLTVDTSRLIDVIISAAILWEEIDLVFAYPPGVKLKLRGLWEGKSITDWRNELIEVMN